ncbi:hypothetical protein JD844_002237 [Phrynosoma platyrhinos]|uniref:Protein Wnt n=1 Tax=Phrynosoma platyrhinos TaxID=52577 RepID=A0ABQ7TB88_PHRPL|nr:hypothetical protein JD844_002237 [Phrynosoma platyrhinos]
MTESVIKSEPCCISSSSFSLTGKEALTQFPLLGPSTNAAHWKAHLKQCDLLRLSRKQKRLCRREPGLAETLRDAIRLGVLECQYQFRNERWNCSLDGRADLLKRGRNAPLIVIRNVEEARSFWEFLEKARKRERRERKERQEDSTNTPIEERERERRTSNIKYDERKKSRDREERGKFVRRVKGRDDINPLSKESEEETVRDLISLEGTQEEGFKETAFLYAVSSAALTHSLARACSAGRMERCTCDDSPDLENRKAWQWGVCGDNLKYSTRFLKNFLGQKKVGKDLRAKVDIHNTNVGIKAVKNGLKTTCKCHGVSGSCAVRTCWKQLSPFHETGKLLKLRYDGAVKVFSATNDAVGHSELVSPQHHSHLAKGPTPPRPTDLVYMEDSPSFCRPSRYSVGTAGRTCSREANCDSMCCGRGYNIQTRMVTFSCHCQVQWCCYVECQQCMQEEVVYTCKQ